MKVKTILSIALFLAISICLSGVQAQVNPLKIKRKEFKKQEVGFKEARNNFV